MTEFTSFRQRLDTVLSTRNIEQVRRFLIEQGQWGEDAPADAELAMWLMIAGSPTLRELHNQARTWLVDHGHEDEAQALLLREKIQTRRPDQGKKARSYKPPRAPRT